MIYNGELLFFKIIKSSFDQLGKIRLW